MAHHRVVLGLPPRMGCGEIALDLEIYHGNPRQLHRPYGEFASLGLSDGKTVWMVEDVADVEKALDRVRRCRWIFHNGTFDLAHLRRWADVPRRPADLTWDTFLIERLLYGGWYDDFGLNDLVRRRLDVYLSKETRKEYAQAHELTPAMRDYASKDPYYTFKVYQQQAQELKADPLSEKVWNEIDGPALWATLAFKGITLNVRKWKAVAAGWQAKADEIQARYPKVNLNAPGQVLEWLRSAHITVKNTQEETLQPFKDHPLVRQLLDYREASARATRYGQNILEMVEADGKLHPGFKVIGTETGRTACDGPNLQNQPNEFSYRDCYEAARGYRLIDYDYAKQEPNITAQMSGDPELLRCLRQGIDVHLNAAQIVFNNPGLEKYDAQGHTTPDYRFGKMVNLAIGYGLQAGSLHTRSGRPLEECQQVIRRYLATYHGIKDYMDRERALGRQDGFVRSPYGRKIWLNWYGYQANNNAINAPIQAGGGDMIKLALVILHRQYADPDYPVIGPIHDELLAEAPVKTAKVVAVNISQAMIQAYRAVCPDVNAKTIVDGGLYKSWGEKG